jgi:hypothetical protein
MHFLCSVAKLPSLELKTQPKQLLGYLPLYIMHSIAKLLYLSFNSLYAIEEVAWNKSSLLLTSKMQNTQSLQLFT